MTMQRYMSISALTRYLKRKFDGDTNLQDVWLRAEISNFKKHSRGHMYLTLKDQTSRIQSVMFAGSNQHLPFVPENGMRVLVRGEVSVYEPYGQYQLYIKEMQQDGIGNLYLAFEALKKKLEQEGLFAQEVKKVLPLYPEEIGVITSPTGAAIRDIISTVKRRFPSARLTIFPVLVQGDRAPASIAKAIELANKLGFIDVLIVGRGGGSIEELWSFNEEVVARTIFASRIPVISAVGHETDFTIADFVADLRAPTPTAAAELAVPHIQELKGRIFDRTERLVQAMRKKVTADKEKVKHMQASYAFRYPTQLIRQKELDLDRIIEKLVKESKRQFQLKRDNWANNHRMLSNNHPQDKLRQFELTREQLTSRLSRDMRVLLQQNKQKFQQIAGQLNALSPLSIMERGYSLAYDQNRKLVKSVKSVQPGETMKVHMKDGQIDCQVWGIEERESSE